MLVKKKHGNSLIEVMISMGIVVATMMTTGSVINFTYGNRENINYAIDNWYTLEAIKKIVICNYSYEEIKSALKDKVIYLSNDILKKIEKEGYDLLLNGANLLSNYPCVSLQGKEGEGGTMIINIIYYDEKGNELKSVFYKGDYEEAE